MTFEATYPFMMLLYLSSSSLQAYIFLNMVKLMQFLCTTLSNCFDTCPMSFATSFWSSMCDCIYCFFPGPISSRSESLRCWYRNTGGAITVERTTVLYVTIAWIHFDQILFAKAYLIPYIPGCSTLYYHFTKCVYSLLVQYNTDDPHMRNRM